MKRQDFIDKFVPKVRFTDSCWIWIASVSGKYGQMRCDDKIHRAHRLSYAFFVGPLISSQALNHTCENKRCVNPDHLEILSNSDNQKYSKRFCINGHNMDIEGRLNNRHGCAACYKERQVEYKKRYRAKLAATNGLQ